MHKNDNTSKIVLIEDIEKNKDKTLHYEFNGDITELEGCEIIANLDLKSLGEYIEVKGNVKGKIQLECDRCLNKFDYELNFEIDEMYAKNSLYEEYGQEV